MSTEPGNTNGQAQAGDTKLIAQVRLALDAAERFERERTIKVLARQFSWDADTASNVMTLCDTAFQRGAELRGKRGRRPDPSLELAGGAAGADIINSYFRIGLHGFKKNGGPWLTVEKAIEVLQTRKERRLKKNGYHHDHGDNSARGRARDYLRGWLASNLLWLPRDI